MTLQSQYRDTIIGGKVRIFHHEVHSKARKKVSILQLDVGGNILNGHDKCAAFLEDSVTELLDNPHEQNEEDTRLLLNEVESVFSEDDNKMLLAPPTLVEIKEVLKKTNLTAAPGNDGIPSLLYSVCWDTLKDDILDMIKYVHMGGSPSLSQRQSLMVFGSKPKKLNSIKPGDKRRISMLNSDMKILTGIENFRFQKTSQRTISPVQFVSGQDKKILHAVNWARDAIQAASMKKIPCGIMDTDFLAGFDWLIMDWVFIVLKKKGVNTKVIDRVKRLYENNSSIVVVNNIVGKTINNNRGSLRQGDIPSLFWFSVGIDPLLSLLKRNLKGIPIIKIPVFGPPEEEKQADKISYMEEKYTVAAYCDDVKPAVTSIDEIDFVVRACSHLEGASGVRLHRDPDSGKVKILLLGRWKETVTQEMIPYDFIRISEYLDMVGVKLNDKFYKSRIENCEIICNKLKNTVNPWKGGKFMSLLNRAHSVNCFASSKVWYRAGAINIKVKDTASCHSTIKSWIYRDLFEKPSEKVLFRSITEGGLGLVHIGIKCQSELIRTFLETSIHPRFRHNLLHEILYRKHVLEEDINIRLPNTPYYNKDFYEDIRTLRQHFEGRDISSLKLNQIYNCLLGLKVTMSAATDSAPTKLIPLSVEMKNPNVNWEEVWRRVRLRGLPAQAGSFLFRLLHGLLLTQDRVRRLGADKEDDSGRCRTCGEEDSSEHSLFVCQSSRPISKMLLDMLHHVNGATNVSNILFIDFIVPQQYELPCVMISGIVLNYIWEKRVSKKPLCKEEARGEIAAQAEIWKMSNYAQEGQIAREILKAVN